MQAFNIYLPKDLVKRADKIAESEYKNRSELIREALFQYLQTKEEWQKIYEWGKEVKDKFKIKSEDDIIRIIND